MACVSSGLALIIDFVRLFRCHNTLSDFRHGLVWHNKTMMLLIIFWSSFSGWALSNEHGGGGGAQCESAVSIILILISPSITGLNSLQMCLWLVNHSLHYIVNLVNDQRVFIIFL